MASEPEIELKFEGVLEKAGKRFFEGYRKRWFYLEGKQLTYYKAPERTNDNLLGLIDLSRVKSVNPVKMVSNGFQIVTGNRTYHLSAATPELMTEWVSVLRQAMQLKSFQRHRGKGSARTQRDDVGYDMLTLQSRSSTISGSSLPSFDEDDGYEPVEQRREQVEQKVLTVQDNNGAQSANSESVSEGTYEVIDTRRADNASGENTEGSEVGSNGMVADNPPLYATVPSDNNGRAQYRPITPPLMNRDPKAMSLICESDSEGELEGSPVTIETGGTSENPLPSPVGEKYAADEILSFLREGGERGLEGYKRASTTNDDPESVIPSSSESAFTKLKDFLVELESSGR